MLSIELCGKITGGFCYWRAIFESNIGNKWSTSQSIFQSFQSHNHYCKILADLKFFKFKAEKKMNEDDVCTKPSTVRKC